MYGERPISGAIDTRSGELSHIAVSTFKCIGGAAIGIGTELVKGARELMHEETRVVHLPKFILRD